MKFRNIKENEQEQAIFIISQAFYYDCDGEYKLLENNKFRYEDFVGAFNDDGKMIACIQNEPHYMWLDGKSVQSGGICNVATLPEYRKIGLVRELLKLQCDKMYKEGVTMSFLYPFSHPYYNKFGFELCNELYRLTANPKDLFELDFTANAVQFEPGENGTDPEDIINVYNTFAAKYNIMLDRDAWQWERHLEHNPVSTKIRTYIIYGNDKNAIGYIKFEYERKGYSAKLLVKDLAWIDYNGMYQVMAFIGKFYGNVNEISFHVPPEMIPSYFWREPRDFEMVYEPAGMARIINAKEALSAIRKTTSEGAFSIKIDDSFMLQNNKSYKVEWENGETSVTEFSGDCDIECSVLALAQILTGYVGLNKAVSRQDIKVNKNEDLLHKVFHKKACYIADFF